MRSTIALEPAGSQVINKVRVPVFRMPDGGQYVEQVDQNGRKLIMSVEGALALKNGQYPLHPTLDTYAAKDQVPLALQDAATQSAEAKAALRALMGRLIDVKAPFHMGTN